MAAHGRVAAGTTDRRWLDTLARRYTPALHSFFERRLHRKADVQDLVQDVFLRLSRLDDAGRIEKPEHYLFRTASSALRDHIRRQAVRQAHLHDPLHGPRAESLASAEVPLPETLDRNEAVGVLQATLRELPERTRDVFVLRMLEDLRTIDVARSLGISTRAVEKHYARALARISVALAVYRD